MEWMVTFRVLVDLCTSAWGRRGHFLGPESPLSPGNSWIHRAEVAVTLKSQ